MNTTTRNQADAPANAGSELTLGVFCTLGVEVMDLFMQPPYNAVLIDLQHGHWSLDDVKHGVRGAQARGVKPIVRLPADGFWMIETLLDFGCMELVFPMVNSAAQARRIVHACYYAPLGQRSQSTCRAHLLHGKNYGEWFQKNFMLRVMIEHIDAIENFEEILSVTGVTGCLIGPADLGLSMRAVDDKTDVELLYASSLAIGKKLGKSMGIASAEMKHAIEKRKQGFDTLFVSSDRKLILDCVGRQAESWK